MYMSTSVVTDQPYWQSVAGEGLMVVTMPGHTKFPAGPQWASVTRPLLHLPILERATKPHMALNVLRHAADEYVLDEKGS